MPASIHVPMTDPTTSRMRMAPIEVAIPLLIPVSIARHDFPLRTAIRVATAAPSTSAI